MVAFFFSLNFFIVVFGTYIPLVGVGNLLGAFDSHLLLTIVVTHMSGFSLLLLSLVLSLLLLLLIFSFLLLLILSLVFSLLLLGVFFLIINN